VKKRACWAVSRGRKQRRVRGQLQLLLGRTGNHQQSPPLKRQQQRQHPRQHSSTTTSNTSSSSCSRRRRSSSTTAAATTTTTTATAAAAAAANTTTTTTTTTTNNNNNNNNIDNTHVKRLSHVAEHVRHLVPGQQVRRDVAASAAVRGSQTVQSFVDFLQALPL
jgi:hypothetical protein